MFYSPGFHWKGCHVQGVIFNNMKCFCPKSGTYKLFFFFWSSHSLLVKNSSKWDSSCFLLIKDFRFSRKGVAPSLYSVSLGLQLSYVCLPYSIFSILRFTSMMWKYFDPFQHLMHLILPFKMGATEIPRWSTSFWDVPWVNWQALKGISSGQLPASTAVFSVLISSRKINSYRPNIDLPCHAGFAGS